MLAGHNNVNLSVALKSAKEYALKVLTKWVWRLTWRQWLGEHLNALWGPHKANLQVYVNVIHLVVNTQKGDTMGDETLDSV